uniref:Uncharacterized protein n=1 Tax=Neovison vison TaxID=452646 RepID=A0A8C7BJC7_NEOVI
MGKFKNTSICSPYPYPPPSLSEDCQSRDPAGENLPPPTRDHHEQECPSTCSIRHMIHKNKYCPDLCMVAIHRSSAIPYSQKPVMKRNQPAPTKSS